jgi:hypothetical protein
MRSPLHIVSFDVPYPADYGGVIDVFNRLKALHHAGYAITLHCFDYGRGKQDELSNFTEQVHYYKRKNRVLNLLKKEPMIVASRNNQLLLANLMKDHAPILFEGQHTSSFLNHFGLKGRKKIVRLHNVEHEYYNGLSKTVSLGLKKSYFKAEAKKLRKHEPQLMHADALLCINPDDFNYYSKIHKHVYLLPPVYETQNIAFHSPQNNYILFHGNLSVGENIEAVEWICKNIANHIDQPIFFAGKNPSNELKKIIRRHAQCKLISNPSKDELKDLLNNAAAHLLVTFRPSGIKLKLLDALSTSSPVICNSHLVRGSYLDKHCIIAHTAEEFIHAIHNTSPITENEFQNRLDAIEANYSPQKHVEQIELLLNK